MAKKNITIPQKTLWTRWWFWLLLIFFILGMTFLCSRRGKDLYFELFGGKMSISQYEVPDYKKKVEEAINELKDEDSEYEKILMKTEKDNLVLRDSIATLRLVIQKRINRGEFILNTFQGFSKMRNVEQENFLESVIVFLNNDRVPENKIDIGIAQRLEKKDRKIGELENRIRQLEASNIDLAKQLSAANGSIVDLGKKIEALSKEKTDEKTKREKANQLLNDAYAQINRLRNSKVPTGVDSTIYVNAISGLSLQLQEEQNKNNDLLKTNSELDNKLKNVRDLRLESIGFEPKDTKRRSDKTYPLCKLGEIKFTFIPSSNYQPEKKQDEDILVVFRIPIMQGEEKIIKKEKTVSIGEKVTFTVRPDDLSNKLEKNKFSEGLYSVQVFYLKLSKTEPILIETFSVTKCNLWGN